MPEQDGNWYEMAMGLTNYSIGSGLADLSVISREQVKEYKRSRALIDSLPNISEILETGELVEMKSLAVANQVSNLHPMQRIYILVLAAPTVDDNLIEIALDPNWAIHESFGHNSEMAFQPKPQQLTGR